jgi:hypothetical protein
MAVGDGALGRLIVIYPLEDRQDVVAVPGIAIEDALDLIGEFVNSGHVAAMSYGL